MQAWISANEGARALHVARHTFQRIAAAANVRRQVLPGLTRYSREDVERLARESIIEPAPAGQAVAG